MINIKKINCTGCAACMAICPQNCIRMEESDEGFLYPTIDESVCINCSLCEKVCPIINIKTYNNIPQVYAIQIKDKKLLSNSSSGGMFSAMAYWVIEHGGMVVGAAFDENFEVEHICIENIGDLYKLQGSKYVQSDSSHVYKQIEKKLNSGRFVMFVGTPCQVEGISSYIKETLKEKLILVDILCHGVPSRKVWRKYLQFRYGQDGQRPTAIYFRDKEESWQSYSIKFVYYKSGKEFFYRKTLHEDLFLKGFLRNLYLRRSCYDCSFKSLSRCSDIMIGDFWKIKDLSNKFDMNGISLVFCHTKKGNKLIENIQENLLIEKMPDSKKISNGGLIHAAYYNIDRDRFFKELDKKEFNELYKKYFADRLISKMKRFISRNITKRRRKL